MRRRDKRNALRMVELADTFGHLAFNKHGQTVEGTLNLSIPCARLVKAGIVLRVEDTYDGVNDEALWGVEDYVRMAVAFQHEQHGPGWWDEKLREVGLPVWARISTTSDPGIVHLVCQDDVHVSLTFGHGWEPFAHEDTTAAQERLAREVTNLMWPDRLLRNTTSEWAAYAARRRNGNVDVYSVAPDRTATPPTRWLYTVTARGDKNPAPLSDPVLEVN